MFDNHPKIILLAGAPFARKSTPARLMAKRLDVDLVHTDDLGIAATAMSAGRTRRLLDPTGGEDYRRYYLARAPSMRC